MRRAACVCLGLALCVGVASGRAAAGGLENGVYLELEGGGSFWDDANVSVSGIGSGKVKFEAGWTAGGAIGFRAFDMLRLEAHGSFRRADLDSVHAGSISVSGQGWAGSAAFLGNAFLDVPIPFFPVHPYVGGGAGVAIFSADTNGNSIHVNGDDTKFAWNAIGGILWPVFSHLELDAHYRYIKSDDPTVDAEVFGLGDGKVKAEFSAHEVVGALRVVF